jgi:hypothetical protein
MGAHNQQLCILTCINQCANWAVTGNDHLNFYIWVLGQKWLKAFMQNLGLLVLNNVPLLLSSGKACE